LLFFKFLAGFLATNYAEAVGVEPAIVNPLQLMPPSMRYYLVYMSSINSHRIWYVLPLLVVANLKHGWIVL